MLLRKGTGVYLKLCLYGGRANSWNGIREGLLCKSSGREKDLVRISENIQNILKRGRGLSIIIFCSGRVHFLNRENMGVYLEKGLKRGGFFTENRKWRRDSGQISLLLPRDRNRGGGAYGGA